MVIISIEQCLDIRLSTLIQCFGAVNRNQRYVWNNEKQQTFEFVFIYVRRLPTTRCEQWTNLALNVQLMPVYHPLTITRTVSILRTISILYVMWQWTTWSMPINTNRNLLFFFLLVLFYLHLITELSIDHRYYLLILFIDMLNCYERMVLYSYSEKD